MVEQLHHPRSHMTPSNVRACVVSVLVFEIRQWKVGRIACIESTTALYVVSG